MEGTIKCSANYVPLSPISFLDRAAIVFGYRTSVVYGDLVYTWRHTRERCLRLSSALSLLGLTRNDVVAAMAPNVPALCELMFGAPMAGALMCVINTRFDAPMVASCLQQIKPKVFFVDYEFLPIAQDSLKLLSQETQAHPIVIPIPEPNRSTPNQTDYENLLLTGNPDDFEIVRPDDECDPIALNFTSGTTGNPKCAVYSHRGAYLNAMAVALITEMRPMPVYLWTVPMFHCSGWCSVWSVAAMGGTNVCIRETNAKAVFDNIVKHNVTHMGGAPAVLNMIVNAPENEKKTFSWTVNIMTGGAPPPPQIISKMQELGFQVTCAYGATEVYGPGTVNIWKPEWESLPRKEELKLKARQGRHHCFMEEAEVVDAATMKPVPDDAKTIGNIVFRGNTVMQGYLNNPEATVAAFRGGWFWTHDLGVKHPDGYIEMVERSQDAIFSDGKMVGSTEIEAVLFSHPAVLEAAVVGRLDEALGQSVCAFVKLKEGTAATTTAEEIVRFCEERLDKIMVPKTIVFEDHLPKTATGKTQKYHLREKAKAMASA